MMNKIKLSYNPTYTFSLADAMDASETQMTFEAHSRQASAWSRLTRAWLDDEAQDVGRALEIVGQGIIAVSQDGQRYPLGGREGAEALRDAIEAENPGYGDEFIKNLALGFFNHHFQRLGEMMGNSSKPSPASGDGSTQNGLKRAVKA